MFAANSMLLLDNSSAALLATLAVIFVITTFACAGELEVDVIFTMVLDDLRSTLIREFVDTFPFTEIVELEVVSARTFIVVVDCTVVEEVVDLLVEVEDVLVDVVDVVVLDVVAATLVEVLDDEVDVLVDVDDAVVGEVVEVDVDVDVVDVVVLDDVVERLVLVDVVDVVVTDVLVEVLVEVVDVVVFDVLVLEDVVERLVLVDVVVGTLVDVDDPDRVMLYRCTPYPTKLSVNFPPDIAICRFSPMTLAVPVATPGTVKVTVVGLLSISTARMYTLPL